MVETDDVIIEKIKEFFRQIKTRYPVKKMLLYGSYVHGTKSIDSDIDVAVVLDIPDSQSGIEIGAELYQVAVKIDPRIEPKLVRFRDYTDHEPASILGEICRTALVVV